MNETQSTAPRMTTMSAKFAGACRCGCGASIAVGQRIEWSRESGARIVGHASQSTAVQSPATRGQRIAAERTTYGQRRGWGSGHGSAAQVAGYSRYCTDNASCRCYDCAS